MLKTQFIDSRQKWLRSITARLAMIVVVAIAILGILASTAPMSQAESILPDIAVTTQITKVLKATVYRSPDCSCCGGWIKHLRAQGFKVNDFPTSEIEAIKQKLNVPDNLTSCHTAIINGYVIEGHVPANDIKRLLQEKPNVLGLAVPQMPVGTPGMETGNQKDPFTVFSFNRQNTVMVFNKYP
jgi:hypothetical protein